MSALVALLSHKATSFGGFVWGNWENWSSSNAAWAGPGGHMDDLNVGRMQPPAAFPMDVM